MAEMKAPVNGAFRSRISYSLSKLPYYLDRVEKLQVPVEIVSRSALILGQMPLW